MAGGGRERPLIFPREHGAWGMLLVPLLTGAAVGILDGGRAAELPPFVFAALALFWLRTPVESWMGSGPVRARTAHEVRLVRRWVLALGAASAAALTWLFWGGRNMPLVWIGAAAAAAFGAQAAVKRIGKSFRTAAQMVGAAGLTATAPAAYATVTGRFDAAAAALWIANLLFAMNQIHYVQLRIHAARAAGPREKLAGGRWFVAEQAILTALVITACVAGVFRWYAAAAFVPVLVRGFAWFARGPEPLVIHKLGRNELFHACAFGVLLALGFALP
jgi:hypothetical protein